MTAVTAATAATAVTPVSLSHHGSHNHDLTCSGLSAPYTVRGVACGAVLHAETARDYAKNTRLTAHGTDALAVQTMHACCIMPGVHGKTASHNDQH